MTNLRDLFLLRAHACHMNPKHVIAVSRMIRAVSLVEMHMIISINTIYILPHSSPINETSIGIAMRGWGVYAEGIVEY